MSQNIHDIYVANPATTLQTTDLFYLGRTPYAGSDDFATTWQTMLTAILPSIPGAVTNVVTGATATLVPNQNFLISFISLCQLTLPITAAVGTIIRIVGLGPGAWQILQRNNQIIHVGKANTTLGVSGALTSFNETDCIELMCVVANLEFTVVSGVSAAFQLV